MESFGFLPWKKIELKMNKNKTKKKKLIWWILGGLLAVVFTYFYFGKKKEEPTKVSVTEVDTRTIIETVYASGKLFPTTEVEITSNVSGTIVELLVEVGQNVKEGQLLAKIDPEALASILERAEAGSNAARAQLDNIKAQKNQLEVQLNNAKIVLDRNRKLLKDGVISQAEFDISETNYKSTLANISALDKSILSAQFNVQSSDATVKEQKKNLSQTYIYAPMSGIVTKINKKKGEQVVGTIQMAGTPILNIANLNSIEVRVDVNERDILNVSMGDTADIELDAYPGRKFAGIVTRIANTANNINGLQLTSDQVTNFEVRVLMSQNSYKDLQITDDKPPFRAGLSASVEIKTNTLQNILTIPISSVTAKEDDKIENKSKEEEKDQTNLEKAKEYVFLSIADSVKMIEVVTGIQDDKFIEVKSGLKQKDKIVAAPYEAISKKLKSGSKIKIVKESELYESEGNSWKK
jgi:HlyD family secretion protein